MYQGNRFEWNIIRPHKIIAIDQWNKFLALKVDTKYQIECDILLYIDESDTDSDIGLLRNKCYYEGTFSFMQCYDLWNSDEKRLTPRTRFNIVCMIALKTDTDK